MLHAYLRNILTLLLIIISVLSMSRCSEKHSPPLPELVDFNFDIRPILVQKCYLCHGPDSGSRKAGLRLDTFEGATAALKDGGQAIIPGHATGSKLIARINSDDPELIMPPPETKLSLTPREISLLTKWIKQGAEWKPHWALIPPQNHVVDKIADDQNEIDYFIDRRLGENGLDVASEANKNSLIRRVSYVLTGLPPSADAIERFLFDKSQGSYEKMVDRFLNSPRFGEKWARHWMDVVRYAETKGHEFDYVITGAWMYRDYLIRAFNEDIGYDQLVREQLAGDLLNVPRRNPITHVNESQFGTTFYTLTEGTHSPVDVRQDEADRIDNMIDVTSKTFQALTVSCARCHDHKFDPITAADYYSFFGIMESSRFTPVPAGITIKEEQDIEEVNKIEAYIRKMMADKWKENSDDLKPISQKKALTITSNDTTELQVIGDFRNSDLDGWKSDGLAFGQHTTLGKPVFNERNKLIRLADGRASSRSVSTGIFGALRSPNFIITKKFIGVRAAGKNSSIRIIIDNFQLISYPIYGGMTQKVDQEGGKNYIFDVGQWKGHKAYVEVLPGTFTNHVYSLAKDAYVEVEYTIAFDDSWKEPELKVFDETFTAKHLIDNWSQFSSTAYQVASLNELLRSRMIQQEFSDATDLILKRAKFVSGIYDSIYFNGITDGFGINSPVFIRGSHKEVTQPVPRKFLSAIPVKDSILNSHGSGRLALASAIISLDNPLTSRVMVNRIWHHIFGKGIVETVDNFGLQGKLPTHPELLDFLAIKFQKEAWSIKKMVRYMVMSKAFKRSVTAPEEARKIDPDNLLLSHYPTRRLEAEDVRDALLAASGRLDTTMYGLPVPMHINDFMQGRGKPSNSGPLDGNGRRSIYQEVRRNFLEPMMLTFDRPIPFTTFGKRNITNVPAQSLILMNDPFVILQAEVMAKELIKQGLLTLDQRVVWIFKRTFSREPSQQEINNAKSFLMRIAEMHDVKENDILVSLDVWRDYCHSVFNLKEFIYLI